MFKSSDLSPAGPHIIIKPSAAHQSAAERATFEMAEVKLSSGEYSIFNNTSSRAKSNVWEAFGVILDGENNQHPTLFETNMQLRVLIIARFHCSYICGFGSGCGSCADGSGRVAELFGNMCGLGAGALLHVAGPGRGRVLKIRPVQDSDLQCCC